MSSSVPQRACAASDEYLRYRSTCRSTAARGGSPTQTRRIAMQAPCHLRPGTPRPAPGPARESTESNSSPTPVAPARRAAVNPIAALATGPGDRGRAQRRVVAQPPSRAPTAWRRARQLVGEPCGQPVHRLMGQLEVGSDARRRRRRRRRGPGTARPATRRPRRQGRSRAAAGAAGTVPPSRGHRLQAPARRLQRVRQVAGEPAVVLARHHAVEPRVCGERRLRAKLGDDRGGVEAVVRVEPQRHRSRCKWRPTGHVELPVVEKCM